MVTKSPPGQSPPTGSHDPADDSGSHDPVDDSGSHDPADDSWAAGPPGGAAATLRIGEVAKLAGLTTRTLRYWEEIGLISPSGYRESGERLYSPADANRAARIRELQDVLGFSLAEVRMVLETEDVFDGLRSAYRGDASDARLLKMVDEAIVANDRLMTRLDDTLARIHAFRDERTSKAERLRSAREDLVSRSRSPVREGTAGPDAGERTTGRVSR